MIRDETAARLISGTMLAVGRRLDESLDHVRPLVAPEEFEAYRRSVGKVMAEILLEILNPQYERHPSMRPPEIGATGRNGRNSATGQPDTTDWRF